MPLINMKRRETGRKRKFIRWLCLWLVIFLTTGWAASALWVAQPSSTLRIVAIVLYLLGALLPPLLLRPFWLGGSVSGVLFACVLIWFLSLAPSNNRDWQPDLAILPWAEIEAEEIVLHNIRNCDYQTETDFTCDYYDRVLDLAKLQGVDLFLVYWGSPHIAHTMLSFGFEGSGNVCFSIETRKEKGEDYSAFKGFFRQYEKIYVMADERDLVRLRTNYRHEDVYLYSLRVEPETARKVFLDYLQEINRLKEQPEWYNALTANCTTSIRQHTKPYNPGARLDWRLIINGYIDQMIYERGGFKSDLPFAPLKEASHINVKARAAGQSADFSRHIREGLPGRSE